jgi:RNA polymerase sigma-70 factor (ECF subfamily)
MRKKTFASSARVKRRAKSAKHTPDSQIDFSDIPESTDLELASARRVGRPSTGKAKQLIALRIDPALLAKLRELAVQRQKPYQTMLHDIIEAAVTEIEPAGFNRDAINSSRLIFERYYRPILSFIRDLVGTDNLADELTQETFARAFRNLQTFRQETKLSTWLFGIAKNVARESLRARIRQNQRVDLDDQQVVDLGDRGPVPVSQLLNKELNEAVQQALASLDEDKRLVFTLKVFQQCSYEEIAETTGFSIPKLKTDLHRARTEMRRQLGQYVRLEEPQQKPPQASTIKKSEPIATRIASDQVIHAIVEVWQALSDQETQGPEIRRSQ